MVGLYMNPPEHAVVLCVDGETQIQALEGTRSVTFGTRLCGRLHSQLYLSWYDNFICSA